MNQKIDLDFFKNNDVEIWNGGPGIGDQIYYTFVPEIVYANTGRKLIDNRKAWYYDYNPYVVRNCPSSAKFNPWDFGGQVPSNDFKSYPDYLFGHLGFKIPIRRPRLYRFEDVEKIPHSICIHTTGAASHHSLSDKVIDFIARKYRRYTIYQIGGRNDKSTPFIDKREIGMWETAELIARCEMFIGVDSGMLHIANCYPSVWKKVILSDGTTHGKQIYPCTSKGSPNWVWIDYGLSYFNETEHDDGITYSYTQI